MDVVVTGANGFVGSGICSALLARGDRVTAVVRRTDALPALPAGVTPLLLPVQTDEAAVRAGLPPATCLIHAAGNATLRGSRRADAGPHTEVESLRVLARAAGARGYRRFVFISSIAVLGTRDNGAPFTAASAAAPGWPYARIKLEAEEALLEIGRDTAMETVILRPPMVYGPGNRGNFPRLVRWVASGLPLPLAGAGNARSYIYIGNLADAAALCARHLGAADRTFLLADARDWPTASLIRLIGRELRRPARLWPLPAGLLRAIGRLAGRSHEIGSLLNSRRIDAAEIRAATGWIPPHEGETSLALTVRWSAQGPGVTARP